VKTDVNKFFKIKSIRWISSVYRGFIQKNCWVEYWKVSKKKQIFKSWLRTNCEESFSYLLANYCKY
jgi:hypothetical protein